MDDYRALKRHLDSADAIIARAPATLADAARAREECVAGARDARRILEAAIEEQERLANQERKVNRWEDRARALSVLTQNNDNQFAQLLLANCATEVLVRNEEALDVAKKTYRQERKRAFKTKADAMLQRAKPLVGAFTLVAALAGAYAVGEYRGRQAEATVKNQTENAEDQTATRTQENSRLKDELTTLTPEERRTTSGSGLEQIINHVQSRKFSPGETIEVIDPGVQQGRIYKFDLVEVKRYPVSTAKKAGPKTTNGDGRTPENKEGEYFQVLQIQDSSFWSDPFEGRLAYGPYFYRFDTLSGTLAKMSGGKSPIGGHGTHEEHLVGTRASHGCVRHENRVVRELVEKGYVKVGTPIVIKEGIFAEERAMYAALRVPDTQRREYGAVAR